MLERKSKSQVAGVGVTVGAESHLRDGHPVWTMEPDPGPQGVVILCGPCPSSVPGPEKIYVLCGLRPHLRGDGNPVWPVPGEGRGGPGIACHSAGPGGRLE